MEGTPSKVIRGVLRGKVKMQIDTPLVSKAVRGSGVTQRGQVEGNHLVL